MRLFHASEEAGIEVFEPRPPLRPDLEGSPPLVWAVSEERLHNFLSPRDCPRVTFHARPESGDPDVASHLSGDRSRVVVAFEEAWRERIESARIWLYEFEPRSFVLQDEIAGYWVSTSTELPIGTRLVADLLAELASRRVEVRFLPSLWPLAEAVSASSLGWSLCRMRYASPRSLR